MALGSGVAPGTGLAPGTGRGANSVPAALGPSETGGSRCWGLCEPQRAWRPSLGNSITSRLPGPSTWLVVPGRARGPAGSSSESEDSPDVPGDEEEEGESESGCQDRVGEDSLVVTPHRQGLPRGVLSPEEDSSERLVYGSEG